MKNFLKIFILMFTIAFVSCDDEEPIYYSEGPYVAFSEGSISATENNTSIAVELYRSSTDLSEPLTVSLSLSSAYIETTEFNDAGDDASDAIKTFTDIQSVTIPAGQAKASIVIYAVNDDFPSGNKEVTVTITDATSDEYTIGFPGPSKNNSSVVITLVDDDCPVDIASFEGSYTISAIPGADYNASFAGVDLCGDYGYCPTGSATVTVDESDQTGTTLIISGPDFGSNYVVQLITCTGQVRVITPTSSFLGTAAWNMQQGAELGTFDPDSKDLNIVGVLGTNGDWVIQLRKE